MQAQLAEFETSQARSQRASDEAEAELRRERNLARTYFDIAGAILVVLDRQGRIQLLNRRGHEVLGYGEGEVVGKDWFEVCLPESARSRVRDAFLRIMAGELEPFEYYENAIVTRSGEERTIAWHNTLLVDERGNRAGTLSSGEDITERLRAEQSLRRSHEELERRVTERTAELARTNERLKREIAVRADVETALRREQQVLEQLLQSGDHERMLVAYEIHDGLAQQLAAAKMELSAARRAAPGGRDDEAALDRVDRLLDQSLKEARRLISDLRPLEVDEAGVVVAVEQLASEAAASGGPAVEFHHKVRADRLPRLVENALLRAAQEGLANARRHSHSDKVRIDLVERPGRLHLEVRDWGKGFDPSEVLEGSFGLEGIRQRARLLGGRVRIDSSPGRGTLLTVEIPLGESAPAPRPP